MNEHGNYDIWTILEIITKQKHDTGYGQDDHSPQLPQAKVSNIP